MSRNRRLAQPETHKEAIRRHRGALEGTPGDEADAVADAFLKVDGPARAGQVPALRYASSPTRASVVNRLQHEHGNAYVQRMLITRQTNSTAQSPPTTPLLPEIWARLPQWMHQNVRQQPALQDMLLTLHAKLGSLWSHVRQVTWISNAGEMDFEPVDDSTLQAALIAAGYAASYFPAGKGNRWGLREPRAETAGLHWRGLSNGRVNVHIDLHPPSGTGLWHLIQDKWRREKTHTTATVQVGVEALDIYIPVKHEQKIHGQLVIACDGLDKPAQGKPEAQAALKRSREKLAEAGSILWNREAVEQADLEAAQTLLLDALMEVAVAREHIEEEMEQIPATSAAP
ncbi:MAG: hypothetical protein U0641_18170 [Anaerolineae bacterium]